MVSQFGRKGFIFEQYDDKSGEGLKHKPFAGWSALVLLIMAEMY
jgi:mannosyl-oligosaccharide glucosidase